jgi:hypothetical protein
MLFFLLIECIKGVRHEFWGAKLVEGIVVGNNMMGKTLMELRDELKISTN